MADIEHHSEVRPAVSDHQVWMQGFRQHSIAQTKSSFKVNIPVSDEASLEGDFYDCHSAVCVSLLRGPSTHQFLKADVALFMGVFFDAGNLFQQLLHFHIYSVLG